MASRETFDPYYKWLGIAPKDQPPHLYRLLGVELFESDPEVISSAADQRMAHVRTFQQGPHAADTQRLLNELAAARARLLNPLQRSIYDAQLLHLQDCQIPDSRRLVAAVAAPPQHLQPPPADRVAFDQPLPTAGSAPSAVADGRDQPFTPPEFVAPVRPRRVRSPVSGLVNVLGFAVSSVLGLSLGYLILCWIGPQYDFLHLFSRVARVPDGETARRLPHEDLPEQPPPVPVRNERGATAAPAEPSPQPTPPQNDLSNAAAGPAPAAAPSGRLPIPADAELQTASAHAKDLLEDAKPAEVLATIGADLTPVERYALLVVCRDAAVAAGDCETAFHAVDELAQGFELDALRAKVEIVRALRAGAAATIAYGPLAQECLELANQTREADQVDQTKELTETALWAARKSGDPELVRQATMAVLASTRPPTP